MSEPRERQDALEQLLDIEGASTATEAVARYWGKALLEPVMASEASGDLEPAIQQIVTERRQDIEARLGAFVGALEGLACVGGNISADRTMRSSELEEALALAGLPALLPIWKQSTTITYDKVVIASREGQDKQIWPPHSSADSSQR